jgi:hypothetical protein
VRRWLRLLDHISPWHRGYIEGWDDGINDAAQDLEILLQQHDGDVIPRARIEALAARLRAELDDAH